MELSPVTLQYFLVDSDELPSRNTKRDARDKNEDREKRGKDFSPERAKEHWFY